MPIRSALSAAVFALICLGTMAAQEPPIPQLTPGSARRSPAAERLPATAALPQTIALAVSAGTPLQVALEGEVHVRRVGQPVQARIVEPVYAFDRLVVPVGSEVTGQISKIGPISGGKRTLAALDADFTPAHKLEVSFDDLVLPDGKHIPLQASVTPGSGQIVRLVSAADSKKKGVKDSASEKARQAKAQARQEWDNAMQQLKMPGRPHRLRRYVEAQLPVHGQYIPAGTVYFVELNAPLDFGSEPMTPEMASSLGSPLPPGSLIHTRLVTPLTSATSQKGDAVEAVISQPVLDDAHHLVVPEGSRLTGVVSQVQTAHRMKKNGQLRLVFQNLIQADGIHEKVEATLEGVEVGKDADVKLDSEGGAEATTPKTRYLATGLSLGLAAASMRSDTDVDHGVAHAGGDPGSRIAGGVNGFKLVGLALGMAVRSRALGYTMGGYGAGMSVYSHFIARGREVSFPKNTAMEIGIGRQRD
jgi:hypothetical protein